MRILDKYILKKYLSTFFFILLILIPVIVVIDTGEKIDKFLRHPDLTVGIILTDYFVNFIINIGNMILPLALFVSVLMFTSKLSGNTEIIAMNSARISFTRFLKPYFIGATIVAILILGLNHFIVPNSNRIYEEFYNTYLKSRPIDYNHITNINLQLSDNEYIYMRSFDLKRNTGVNFSYEVYEGNLLKEKFTADRIVFKPKDTIYRLTNFYKRKVGVLNDGIEYGRRMDTIFNFMPKDLLYIDAFAKEMQTPKLLDYIKISKARGRGNLNVYYVELYKRTSLAVAAYILTLIAVSLGAVKRRGGIGINLAVGVTIVFVYVFLLRIVEVVGGAPDSNPLFMVWMPNVLFGILAIYLYQKAKK
ncbi:MAG: permease [Flavobacteriaceae bacterium]|nr:MAG: permease [Flavobacteriaceae bacterium]